MESNIYVGYEELVVSNDEGRRVVHYYLKKPNGGSDLAVVGREKSPRHMFYTVANQALSFVRPSTALKWRSRREVLDWLSSHVTDSHSDGTSIMTGTSDCDHNDDPSSSHGTNYKELIKAEHSKDFFWVGPSWMCRKRRKHYQSFNRNGVVISVHDFVYVMSEDNKRLVAYLEDLYEDSRAKNMVLVRWFHKIDEVGNIVLPPDSNDREIFFSLCLQDLHVECIDGVAMVLSPQHFHKFLSEAAHTLWDPYMCRRQVDYDNIMAFDITQVQGYWEQDLLKYMFTSSQKNESKHKRKHTLVNGSKGVKQEKVDTKPVPSVSQSKNVNSPQSHDQMQWSLSSEIEVLSQDSGIRGCWFRCVIIKVRRNKIKVQYMDVKDADESGNLEEWVSTCKLALLDKLGLRLAGRTTVRPCRSSNVILNRAFDVGVSVDAWWCDGWWEGIVIGLESEDKFRVYFPGEHQTLIFSCCDLRLSQDFVHNQWYSLQPRPDIVTQLSSEETSQHRNRTLCHSLEKQATLSHTIEFEIHDSRECATYCDQIIHKNPNVEPPKEKANRMEVWNPDREGLLALVKWNTSKKRRCDRESNLGKGSLKNSKRPCIEISRNRKESSSTQRTHIDRIMMPKPLQVEHEKCKYGESNLFTNSAPASNLVMTM